MVVLWETKATAHRRFGRRISDKMFSTSLLYKYNVSIWRTLSSLLNSSVWLPWADSSTIIGARTDDQFPRRTALPQKLLHFPHVQNNAFLKSFYFLFFYRFLLSGHNYIDIGPHPRSQYDIIYIVFYDRAIIGVLLNSTTAANNFVAQVLL